jgi:hypothetical protein
MLVINQGGSRIWCKAAQPVLWDRSFPCAIRRSDWLRAKLGFKIDDADTFPSRMKGAKNKGYLCGSREVKLFMLAVGKALTRERAMDCLDRPSMKDESSWSVSTRPNAKSRLGICRVGSGFCLRSCRVETGL